MTTASELPPLPNAGLDFAEDDEFLAVTKAQDRVIETLHKDGWTLRRVFTAPNAVLPLPRVKYPEGRVYLFSDDVAVIVQKSNGRVIASLPAHAALNTLHQLTPEILLANEWAAAQWNALDEDDAGPFKRWHKQNFFTRDGARWTVERNADGGADITKDGTLVYTVEDDYEAEKFEMHDVIVELVAYVVRDS